MSDVDLQFGANTTDVDKGVASVNQRLNDISTNVNNLQSSFNSFGDEVRGSFSAVEDGLGNLNSAFKDLNDSIEKGGATLSTGWMKVLLGVGAGGAAAGLLTVFHNIEEGFIKIETGAREASISMERFQELTYALNQSGASTDKMTSGLTEAAKKLNDLTHDAGDLGKFLDENNVKWKDSAGNVIDMNKYLEISASLIANAKTEGDRFKAGDLLGWSKEWVRVLQGGPAVLRQLADEAHASGAVFNDELIRRSVDFENEWNKASLAWSTYFKQLIVDLTPYVMSFINALGKAVSYVVDVIKALGGAIAEDFKDAFNPSSSFKPLTDSAQVLAGTMPGLYQSMSQFMDVSEKSKVNWDGIVSDAKAMSADMARLATDSFATGDKATKFPGKDDKDDTSAQLSALNAQIDAWRSYYEKLKIFDKNQVDTFKMTEAQKTSDLLAALDQRATAVKGIYDQEIKVAGDNANKVAEIRRRMNRELETIDKERMQIEAENLKRSVQEWQTALSTITSAFNSQLRGLLAGTTTWAQAMKNIVADLVIKIIEEFEKIGVQKLASGLASAFGGPSSIFGGLFGGGGQTAATTANTSALTALTTAVSTLTAAMGGTTAASTTEAATTATSTVATGAQTVATTSQTAATIAETAATSADAASKGGGALFSFLGSLLAFDVGTNYVPRTGLALIHEGEAIIPAQYNPAAGGQGAGTLGVNFTVQALDAVGVQAFFTRYGPQIAKMLSSHMQQNPSFQT